MDSKTKTVINEREALCNNKGVNPARRYNIYKYVCTQHRSNKIYKTNTNELKEKINSTITIVGDFNTPLTAMDTSPRQKINKKISALNDTLDQMDITDLYRTLHPKAAKHTFFSSAHGTFPRINHMLGQKSSLNKFKKTEIISSIFSDLNGMKIEITRRKLEKPPKCGN